MFASIVPILSSLVNAAIISNFDYYALKKVLLEAKLLVDVSSRDCIDSLDEAAHCLRNTQPCVRLSDECSKTMTGYCPNSSLKQAIRHYLLELTDIKCFLLTLYIHSYILMSDKLKGYI